MLREFSSEAANQRSAAVESLTAGVIQRPSAKKNTHDEQSYERRILFPQPCPPKLTLGAPVLERSRTEGQSEWCKSVPSHSARRPPIKAMSQITRNTKNR